MDFQEFLKYVPKIKQVPLPAENSHIKLAPTERIEALLNSNLSVTKPRIAGVMMLLYPKKGITHLILIVRNTYKGVHSAQIAFPGGKYEIDDLDYAFTALRETHEEVGILPENIEVIRAFTPIYIPPSHFQVHPFLGISNKEITFSLDPTEVADIIELPLATFLDDRILVEETLSTSYATDIQVPAFKIEEKIVWGATAMILSELKDVLKASF